MNPFTNSPKGILFLGVALASFLDSDVTEWELESSRNGNPRIRLASSNWQRDNPQMQEDHMRALLRIKDEMVEKATTEAEKQWVKDHVSVQYSSPDQRLRDANGKTVWRARPTVYVNMNAATTGQPATQYNAEAQVAELTAQYLSAGGDVSEIPTNVMANNAIMAGWLKAKLVAFKTTKVEEAAEPMADANDEDEDINIDDTVAEESF
jgi:hypothetical protein